MKNQQIPVLNYALYLSLSLMTGTGLMLAYRLPPGSQGGRGLRLFGLGRHEWGDIHLWLSFSFIALMVLHLALHWGWLLKIAAAGRTWRLIAGFGIGLALILVFLFAPVTRPSANEDGRPRWGQHGR